MCHNKKMGTIWCKVHTVLLVVKMPIVKYLVLGCVVLMVSVNNKEHVIRTVLAVNVRNVKQRFVIFHPTQTVVVMVCSVQDHVLEIIVALMVIVFAAAMLNVFQLMVAVGIVQMVFVNRIIVINREDNQLVHLENFAL